MENFDWRDLASITGLILGALSLLFTGGFRSAVKTLFHFVGRSREQSKMEKWNERWFSKHDPYYALSSMLLSIFSFTLFTFGFAYVMLKAPGESGETAWWMYGLRIYLGWSCLVLFGRVVIHGTNVRENREAVIRANPDALSRMAKDYQRHLEEEEFN